jgi:type I restriction enzyme R subunit
MKRALADYALGSEGKADDNPVQEKSVLFELLDDALKQGNDFCRNLGIELETVLKTWETFRNIELFDQYANKILEKDAWKKEFFVYENTITSLYEACKPEILGDTARPLVFVFQYLRGVIDGIINRQDVEEAKRRISALLDQSIIADNKQDFSRVPKPEYKISQKGRTWNLSTIDFEKLKKDFKEIRYKNIELADLRAFIEDKLEKMIKQNTTRKDFAQKLQEIIDNYNAGGSTNEYYYGEMANFAENLNKEEERHIREGLTEDELELFDILKKEKMTRDEEKKVKLAAKSLLHRLLEEHPKVLIQDWHKDTQSQARVKAVVEKVLDDTLPKTYERNIFQSKCNNVFKLIFEYTSKGLKWAA